MLSIQQHKLLNSKYGTETLETALVQMKSKSGLSWMDFSRTTIESAQAFIKGAARDPSGWRVVDWITREEININDTSPEAIAAELNQANPWNVKFKGFDLRAKLTELEALAVRADGALIDEAEGDLKYFVAEAARVAAEIEEFVDGM
jgi:hypothetical protein